MRIATLLLLLALAACQGDRGMGERNPAASGPYVGGGAGLNLR
jgi:hypothetical protein